MAFTSYTVIDDGLQRALNKASKQVSDLTIPFTLIAKSWFKSNKAIYALKGPGKFADLTELYKKTKQRKLGFTYPILRGATRSLEKSITEPTDGQSVNMIVNKKTLILGTKVEYGPFLHFGTVKMKARPFVLIGAEQTGPPEFNKRLEAWIKILEDFVVQTTRKA